MIKFSTLLLGNSTRNHVLEKFLKSEQPKFITTTANVYSNSAESYAQSHGAIGYYLPNFNTIHGCPNPAASYAQSHGAVGYFPDFK
jgi:hypothetical protein